MELQRDRTWDSWKANTVWVAREQKQRQKEHRQSAETGLRNRVREATQTHRMDHSLRSLWWGIPDRGMHPRGQTHRDLGSWSAVLAKSQEWCTIQGAPSWGCLNPKSWGLWMYPRHSADRDQIQATLEDGGRRILTTIFFPVALHTLGNLVYSGSPPWGVWSSSASPSIAVFLPMEYQENNTATCRKRELY